MLRFYFHVRSSTLIRDLEGTELASLEGAHAEAVSCALEIIADGVRAQENRQGWAIEVADEAGETVLVVPFAAALAPATPTSLAA